MPYVTVWVSIHVRMCACVMYAWVEATAALPIFCSLLWHLIPICKSLPSITLGGWRCGWKKAPHPHCHQLELPECAPRLPPQPSEESRGDSQRGADRWPNPHLHPPLSGAAAMCSCIPGQKWSVKAPHSNPVLAWFYDRLRKKTPSRPPCKVGPEPSIWMEYNHIPVFYFPAPGPTGTTMTTKASRTSFVARRGVCTHCSNVPPQNSITALRAKGFFKRSL